MAAPAKIASSNDRASDVSIEDLSKQIEVLKADIAGLTQTFGDFAQAKATEAKDTAKTKAREAANAGRDKVVEAQLHAEEFIQNQPATALGLAAALGFLVGIITARR